MVWETLKPLLQAKLNAYLQSPDNIVTKFLDECMALNDFREGQLFTAQQMMLAQTSKLFMDTMVQAGDQTKRDIANAVMRAGMPDLSKLINQS